MLVVDAHLDLAMNALMWNRDLALGALEMREIERAFEDAGLPTGFAIGATDLYERLAHFKDAGDVDLDDVLAALLAD